MRHFFFYGTLIAGSGNPVEQRVHAKLERVATGTARGRLFAIPDPLGWYPALLPGDGAVHGILYRSKPDFGQTDLTMLDAYEGIDPARPRQSLYRRVRTNVAALGNASTIAEVYRFVASLPPNARPVANGDFPGWLARHKRTAFSG